MSTRNDKVFVVSGKGSSLSDMLWFSWSPGSGTTYPINDYKTPITDHPEMGGNKFDVQQFEKWKNTVKPVKAKKIYAGVMEIYEIPLYPFLSSKDRVEYSSYSTPMARYDIYDVNSSSNQSEHIPEDSIIKPIGKVYCIYSQQKYVFIHFFKTKNEAMGWFNSTMSANESKKYENPLKHVQTFEGFLNEAKMTPQKLADALMNAEEMVNTSLRIDSAEPVYQDPTIRKVWMGKMKEEIEKIGVADIKAKWKKIYAELEDNNYHQLNLFLGLALKADPKYVAIYKQRSEETDGPFSRDAAAIKDFLSVNL